MNQRPIIALDFSTWQEVEQFMQLFPEEEKLFVKIGMELFYQEGPIIVRWLKDAGHEVFLDLKLHDIPNTVEKAMRGLAKLGVDITCVHAAGGIKMMQAALRGLEEGTPAGKKRPLLLAITQLTSTSEADMHHDQLIQVPLEESVIHYAKCAEAAGLDGVVSSALEVSGIKANLPAKISFAFLRVSDQKEASQVIKRGSSRLPKLEELVQRLSWLDDQSLKRKIPTKPIKQSKKNGVDQFEYD